MTPADISSAMASGNLDLAEQAAIERLLNAYLRENGIADPRESPSHSKFCLSLRATQKVISGYITYWSSSGHHAYGTLFWDSAHGAEKGFESLTCIQLIQRLLDELSAASCNAWQPDRSLLANICNSIQKTRQYVQQFHQRQPSGPALDFLISEQSLYFGHPFHPTPKSTEGFSDEDLQHYGPELQATFVPHFWAISPTLIQQAWISDEAGLKTAVMPEAILRAARQRLRPEQADYALLPAHPWQANNLRQWPLVQQLQQSGQLIDLGPLGDRVFPTASVRTVWQPGHGYFYKLPLQVRITNFVRLNPVDQIQRAIDAGKVLTALANQWQRANFQILMEVGYRTLTLPIVELERQQQLIQNFAVVFRATPTEFTTDRSHIFVVASLLEPFPEAPEAKLFQAIRQTNQGKMVDLRLWLHHYLNCSLKPLLHLLADYGISLEAHVQNSLIQLENGFPQRFYNRDLEGMSVDRALAIQHNWFDQAIDETSPVLYSEKETWLRLQYYFVVNHLGHLVATLGRYSEQPEAIYWQVVRALLQAELGRQASPRRRRLILNLLNQPTLPAKANLLSRFQQRSERPLYVPIPNPIAGHINPGPIFTHTY